MVSTNRYIYMGGYVHVHVTDMKSAACVNLWYVLVFRGSVQTQLGRHSLAFLRENYLILRLLRVVELTLNLLVTFHT